MTYSAPASPSAHTDLFAWIVLLCLATLGNSKGCIVKHLLKLSGKVPAIFPLHFVLVFVKAT